MKSKRSYASTLEIEKALWTARGSLALAAHLLEVDYRYLRKRINRSSYLQDLLKEIEEHTKDTIESKLHAAALGGQPWAVKFYLERKARERGYGQEVVVKPTGGITVEVEWKASPESE